MNALKKIFRLVGMGLYGLNFVVLVVYGVRVLRPVDSVLLDAFLLTTNPLLFWIGIKFFCWLKVKPIISIIMYSCLVLMVSPLVWVGSVGAFVVAYSFESLIGVVRKKADNQIMVRNFNKHVELNNHHASDAMAGSFAANFPSGYNELHGVRDVHNPLSFISADPTGPNLGNSPFSY